MLKSEETNANAADMKINKFGNAQWVNFCIPPLWIKQGINPYWSSFQNTEIMRFQKILLPDKSQWLCCEERDKLPMLGFVVRGESNNLPEWVICSIASHKDMGTWRPLLEGRWRMCESQRSAHMDYAFPTGSGEGHRRPLEPQNFFQTILNTVRRLS